MDKIKKYELIVTIKQDGSRHIKRTCDGFNAWELLGLLQETSYDIYEQIKGLHKPDKIERTVIKDKKIKG